ncbi:MAG TPA: hypothetical protein VN375_10405, partial [Vicinamibacteria bacterium]|nr:hypothetical protein [Vicinamibacteria bacterium]
DLPPKVVRLEVRVLPSAGDAEGQQRASESGLAHIAGGAQPIPGLGDGAFWVGGQLDQLHVVSGDTRLIFTVQVAKDPAGAARRLATKALARLRALRPLGGAPAQ